MELAHAVCRLCARRVITTKRKWHGRHAPGEAGRHARGARGKLATVQFG